MKETKYKTEYNHRTDNEKYINKDHNTKYKYTEKVFNPVTEKTEYIEHEIDYKENWENTVASVLPQFEEEENK